MLLFLEDRTVRKQNAQKNINLYCPTRSHAGLSNVLVNGLACHILVSVCFLVKFQCPC
jgi:hypothetical protein